MSTMPEQGLRNDELLRYGLDIVRMLGWITGGDQGCMPVYTDRVVCALGLTTYKKSEARLEEKSTLFTNHAQITARNNPGGGAIFRVVLQAADSRRYAN